MIIGRISAVCILVLDTRFPSEYIYSSIADHSNRDLNPAFGGEKGGGIDEN